MATVTLQAADPDPFPLMAWDYVGDEATLEKMADCGINMVAFVPPDMLDACARRGVRAILYEESIAPERWDSPYDADAVCKALPEVIRTYNNHPALYGYHLRDEPGPDQFPGLAKAAELVGKLAPGKWPYINMTPGMGDGYIDFLELFVKTCNPPILSYDNYPIGEGGTFSYGFWANIQDVHTVATHHDLPLWTIVLTSAHWGYREPTAADLRLQIYGSLVYGARGVCYYKFCSAELPILEVPALGNFRMGPLDQFGEKTRTWDDLRNINRQVGNLGPHLLRLRSDGVYHFGEVPERNHGPGETSLVTGFKSGDNYIVGDFTHEDGSRWVMVVNKELTHSHPCDIVLNPTVKSISYVSPVTGELRPFTHPFYYYLAPGQGVLLKLEM